jgi:FkbM family methyltransferase
LSFIREKQHYISSKSVSLVEVPSLNALTIKARSAARRIGILPLIQRLRSNAPYEHEFGAAMLGAILPGDVVWDVGANIGLYTRQFIDRVGPSGTVIAFEPEPACYEILRQECAGATLANVALGERAGSGFIEFHIEPRNGSHRLVNEPNDSSRPVRIIRGDEYDGPCPNLMKIDVEGFEEEVLMGMPRILADSRLREIFLEVHFAQLEQRGRATAPLRIEKTLETNSFRLKWFRDRSHLRAIRHAQPS